MTYLRILRLLAALLRSAMRHVPGDSRTWAELADWDGHIALRQIDYAKRVQKAAGWEPVHITGLTYDSTRPFTSTTGGTTITANWTWQA